MTNIHAWKEVLTFLFAVIWPVASLSTPRKAQFLLIQEAMEMTKQSASNITAAYTVTERWNKVLLSTSKSSLPETILAISYACEAACLVRIGKDDCAIVSYDQALSLERYLNSETLRDVRIGKAKSLQRLLQYKEARENFLSIRTASAVVAAATCDMRLGDLNSACKTLEQYLFSEVDKATTMIEDDIDSFYEAKGMLETLYYVKSQQFTQHEPLKFSAVRLSTILDAAQNAGCPISPIYKWVHTMAAGASNTSKQWRKIPFIDYCQANIGAFDDHLLLQLDDKVFLHELLSTADNSSQFWPQGMLLPADDLPLLCENPSSGDDFITWICKRRAGYGSHGNSLVCCSFKHAKELAEKHKNDENIKSAEGGTFLLQQMVEPPLLLKDRKFSLRVYVVLFSATSPSSFPDVYVSKEGLIKVAAVPFSDNDEHNSQETSLRMHMTNSGREVSMKQESFGYLRNQLLRSSFDILWSNIKAAVGSVMRAYERQAKNLCSGDDGATTTITETRYALAKLGIPKILGFDFVVDSSLNVWLVEVNRFPGLEPRNEMDKTVKQQIVRDAWRLAANRCSDKRRRNECLSWIASDFTGISFLEESDTLEKVETT